MKRRNVLVLNDTADMGRSYYLPFAFVGNKITNKSKIFSDPKSIALVVFTGGSDVTPGYYGEKTGKATYSDPYRDKEETSILNQASKLKIPMFGICRGLQFLTVMTGGKLIQHVEGHIRQSHLMKTKDKEFAVTSSHHQMVLPKSSDEVIGWSSPRLSHTYLNGNNEELPVPELEIEAVRFNGVLACGVQYHPEIMEKDTPGFQFVEEMIRNFLPTAVD